MYPARRTLPPFSCSQLLKDWKDVGEWLMLIHHVVFPLTYGVSLYALDPPFGTYIMSVFQVRAGLGPRAGLCA